MGEPWSRSPPQVLVELAQGARTLAVDPIERSYVGALTDDRVWTYHAPRDGLDPGSIHRYEVSHAAQRFPVVDSEPRPQAARPHLGSDRVATSGSRARPAPGGGPFSRNAAYAVDAVERAAVGLRSGSEADAILSPRRTAE